MPKETFTLIQLADAYMVNNELDKAISVLDRYEKSEGKSPRSLSRR